VSGLRPDRLGASPTENALGRADQPVGLVSHDLESLDDLPDAILEPLNRVPVWLHSVRAGRTMVVFAHRPGRPRGSRGPRRAVRLLVPIVMMGRVVVEVAD